LAETVRIPSSRAQPGGAKGAEAPHPLARSKLRKKIKTFNI